MCRRFFQWLINLFRRKPKPELKEVKKEVVKEEEPATSVDEVDRITIEEYSPDVFEYEEDDQSLIKEEKNLERQILEIKKDKAQDHPFFEILRKVESQEDIFRSLANEEFWNATGYCDTVEEKFKNAVSNNDEEGQLKLFWQTNKMYMRAAEAYRDALTKNDMLRSRVMLLNIRILYDSLTNMYQLSPEILPEPQTLDVEMRKEYVKDLLMEVIEESTFPLNLLEIKEIITTKEKYPLELAKEESIEFYVQSLVQEKFIQEIKRVIELKPPPIEGIENNIYDNIPELIFEYAYIPDVKMYRREDIGREELSSLFPTEIYKGLQEKGFYRIEDVYGRLDEFEKILLEDLKFEPDMASISLGILRERINRLNLQVKVQQETSEKSLLHRLKRDEKSTKKEEEKSKEIPPKTDEKTPKKEEDEFIKLQYQDIINSPIPRPYQLEAYYMFKGNNYNANIIDSPTGSGKTLMGLMCIQDWIRNLRKNESILVLVPTQNYQSQWVDSICFEEIGLQLSPNFVFSGTVTQLERFIQKTHEIPPIIVLTYTSLAQILGAKRRKEKEVRQLFNWLGIRHVIFDEAHKIVEQEKSATYHVARSIVKLFKGAHIEDLIGFSGTAKSYDKDFKKLGMKLIYVVPEKELVVHGFVAPIAELGVTFAYSGREKAIRELHNEIKVNLKQFWSYIDDKRLRREFQKIPLKDRLFICKELLGMYRSYSNEKTDEKLRAKFQEWKPSRKDNSLSLHDINLVQTVHIYNSWSDKTLANISKHPTLARELIDETEKLILRLEQLIRIPSLQKMIKSSKYAQRLPARSTFYKIYQKQSDRRKIIKEVRDIMCRTMVGIYKALDTWARTKIGEGRVGTFQSIINAEEEIRDVKGVVIFDSGRKIRIEDESGIGSPGFSGVGGSFAQSLSTNIIKYNPIAVQSSEMYVSYNPDLEKPLHVMMADFIRHEIIIDKLSERLFMELIYELPFQNKLSDYLYLQFKYLMEEYVSGLKKVYRVRHAEFSTEIFEPLSEFIDEMVVLDEELANAVNELQERIKDPSIRINNIVQKLYDYASIARKIEYAKKETLQTASGELKEYYYINMPGGRKKQLIYDLVSDFLDAEELPIQLVFVSSWARTGWDVRTPDILIDATATRDTTAWQQLRGRAMRALETWTIDCYRTIAVLLGKKGKADKIINQLPEKMQDEFRNIQDEYSQNTQLTPIMIELLLNSIEETKLSVGEKIQLKEKVKQGDVGILETIERMKLIIYLMLSKNKVAHIFEMVKASGSTKQVEYDEKSGEWRRKAAIAKKHKEEPILPVPGSKRRCGKYIAPLIYSKDPTIDTPTEIKSTLKKLLHGLDEELLDDWVLNLIETEDVKEKVAIHEEAE
ncbi:MAG: DEAD/DEAH box helicase family protein, partial [Asgard group archaeon]|nr:DEAD/DEAH box helicase family protein [Asgard group archaeon]